MEGPQKIRDFDDPIVALQTHGGRVYIVTTKALWTCEIEDYVAPYVFIPLYVRFWRWLKKTA